MGNVSDKSCRKKSEHILFSILFVPKNCPVYDIMWQNTVVPDRLQMAIIQGAEKVHFFMLDN